MFLSISGFLRDDSEDSSLKYELIVKPQDEAAVLKILGWKSLNEGPDGEWLLSDEHVKQIALAVGEQLPTELDVFIGITA